MHPSQNMRYAFDSEIRLIFVYALLLGIHCSTGAAGSLDGSTDSPPCDVGASVVSAPITFLFLRLKTFSTAFR